MAWLRSRSALACALCLALAAISVASAQARTLRNPHIGWPAELRSTLGLMKLPPHGCTRRPTVETNRVEDITIGDRDPSSAMESIFRGGLRDIWGGSWVDRCDKGRLHLGVASGATRSELLHKLAVAREVVRVSGVGDGVRFIAVRSPLSALRRAQRRFEQRLDGVDSKFYATGIRNEQDAVHVDISPHLGQRDRRRMTNFRRHSTVNVVLQPIGGDLIYEDY